MGASSPLRKPVPEPLSSASESSDDEEAPTPSTPRSSSKSSAGTPQKTTTDIAAHRKAVAEAASRLDSALPGTWLLTVHIIEVRELRATDPDGSADPVVIVEVDCGVGKKQKAVTRVVNNDRNAVFDESFKFEFQGLTRPDLEMAQIVVTVVDADISVAGHGAGDVIGSWTADVLDTIYTLPSHEYYRQYVCLENTEATKEEESGTQGFLKLSVAAIGPGDKLKIHNLEKEMAAERRAQEDNSNPDGTMTTCLPPSVGASELRFLVVKLHSIDNFVPPAGSVFVTIEFGPNQFNTTSTKTLPQPHAAATFPARYCAIDQSVSIPVLLPTMSQSIRISVHERTNIGPMKSSKLIATCNILKLSRIRSFPAKFKKLALPFYGAPLTTTATTSTSYTKLMNQQHDKASHYRGRLVLTLTEKKGERSDGTMKAQESKMKVIKPIKTLPLATYKIVYKLITATNLPKTKHMYTDTYSIRVSCGITFAQTPTTPPLPNTTTLSFPSQSVSTMTVLASTDAMQIPSLFVTLCKGTSDTPIAFHRISPVSLLEQAAFPLSEATATPTPKWVHFQEDKSIDAIVDSIFPGSVLMWCGMYAEDDVPEWASGVSGEAGVADAASVMKPFAIEFRVVGGRDLPPWDADTGALDGYVKITVNGETMITSVKGDTRNPRWNEILTFTAMLPEDQGVWPEVVVQVWDRDAGIGESDDFVGNVILPLRTRSDDAWLPLFYQEAGDIEGGELCIGCSVTPAIVTRAAPASSSLPAPTLSRIPFSAAHTTATVQIVALGLRNLTSPSAFSSVNKPFIQMRIGDSAVVKTMQSNRPKPSHCNFSEVLTIENVSLEADGWLPLFLDVKVLDKNSLGLTSLLGTGSFSLGTRVLSRAPSSRGRFEAKNGLDYIHEAPYMKGRKVLTDELDTEPLFSVIPIYRAKKKANATETTKYELEVVGKFHAFVRIVKAGDGIDRKMEEMIGLMRTPRKYKIRVYCLNATGLTAADDKSSDPYLRLKVGGQESRGVTHMKTLKPEFYERHELTCKIPGDAVLTVDVMDWDRFSSDDVIGTTVIDLEERWFSSEWQRLGVKPLESRPLHVKSSAQPQGQLECWVDIVPKIPQVGVAATPLYDITPPLPAEFEIRIVVWKCEGIPPGDAFSDQSDMYVKLRLGETTWRSTDVHYFAKKGKGSFNFRFKFPLQLRQGGKVVGGGEAPPASYLKVQVWDADLLVSDCLAEGQIDLQGALKTSFNTRELGMEYCFFGESGKQLEAAAARIKREKEGSEWVLGGKKEEAGGSGVNERTNLLGDVELGGRGGWGGEEDAKKETKKKAKKGKKKKSFVDNLRGSLGLTAPENSGWLNFSKTDLKTGEVKKNGRVLLGIEVLPASLAGRRVCGEGRNEPNNFPPLPPPEGRVDMMKMMNPFYAAQQCMGDSLAKECGMGCCCVLGVVGFVAFGVLLGPEIQILLSVLNMVPVVVAQIIMLAICVCVCGCSFYFYCCFCRRDSGEDDMEEV